ncbi:WD40-repeat-containing domain protein [Neohortaea acidophila]|uniref:WD40-repeat-containing domain protein n=1 Tax=Neohortaea acidophila TaxID=245834 RepID=A0A6A6PLN1_9PEZI|nr:WD40-repeat-containing domain protein [Neohortaea acidophila]KAF2480726.1 WD40-repeat-containing domain protein [Neohortaea acidophila]
MSTFFTLPASQRKRKRPAPSASAPSKSAGWRKSTRDDESISGSDASDDDAPPPAVDDESLSEEDEAQFEDEDPAAKRVRLAEQYLANTQKEVLEDVGFDAADVDQENLRHRMGERLKEDTAEGKGRLYRRIADGLDWRAAQHTVCRRHGMQKSLTGIAVHGQHIFAVSKDLQLVKLELPSLDNTHAKGRPSRQPTVVARTRGHAKGEIAEHHSKAILCVAVSPDGKFVATGGADKKLIVWDGESLKCLKVFPQHRDAITALAFRRNTNQLYSASKDRTVKTWSLNELAYVETLFGHQDEILDVDALAQETCITVGARDRTARLWKVAEESQLVFRGGNASGTTKALEQLKRSYANGNDKADARYHEGSIDRIAMIDEETFVTGSDNGSLSLWNTHKKKATFVLPLAHGVDPPLPLAEASAEQEPDESLDEESRGGQQPRWITALKAIPFSDVLVSGSWDGYVRAWKISSDKRRIEPLGAVGVQVEDLGALLDSEGVESSTLADGALQAMKDGVERQGQVRGIINDLAVLDLGERGKDGVLIAAAIGQEHRLGRWREMLDGRNCVAIFRVPSHVATNGSHNTDVEMSNGTRENRDDFEGVE